MNSIHPPNLITLTISPQNTIPLKYTELQLPPLSNRYKPSKKMHPNFFKETNHIINPQKIERKNSLLIDFSPQKKQEKHELAKFFEQNKKNLKQRLNILTSQFCYNLNTYGCKSMERQNNFKNKSTQLQKQSIYRGKGLIIQKKNILTNSLVQYQRELNRECVKKQRQIQRKLRQKLRDSDQIKRSQLVKRLNQRKRKINSNFETYENNNEFINHIHKIQYTHEITNNTDTIVSDYQQIRPWTNQYLPQSELYQ